jgi:tRNA (guanine37-N1)-methyltransferase
MVMMAEPLVAAIEHVAAADRSRRILLSRRASRSMTRGRARWHASARCYWSAPASEGVDERVTAYVDEELSIGDYVLSAGEIAALVVIDTVVRLLPGAVGNERSPADDSYAAGLLEHPQYTRPGGLPRVRVPDVLLGGDHAAIARWRRQEALRDARAAPRPPRPRALDAEIRLPRDARWQRG